MPDPTLLARLFDFANPNPIASAELDLELNQIVNFLSGKISTKRLSVDLLPSATSICAIFRNLSGPNIVSLRKSSGDNVVVRSDYTDPRTAVTKGRIGTYRVPYTTSFVINGTVDRVVPPNSNAVPVHIFPANFVLTKATFRLGVVSYVPGNVNRPDFSYAIMLKSYNASGQALGNFFLPGTAAATPVGAPLFFSSTQPTIPAGGYIQFHSLTYPANVGTIEYFLKDLVVSISGYLMIE